MKLQTLIPDCIWYMDQPIKFGPLQISSRMTLVKLSDGTLWVHSPIQLNETIKAEIDAIGTVSAVIAPNLTHHLSFKDFLNSCPEAKSCIAPGLDKKRKDLAGFAVIGDNRWAEDFDSVFVAGLPVINETAWFHKATGTLILADLLFCFGSSQKRLNRVVARMLGVYERLAMSRTMRFSIKNKEAFKASILTIEQWDIQRIILAHDAIVSKNAKQNLSEAFTGIL